MLQDDGTDRGDRPLAERDQMAWPPPSWEAWKIGPDSADAPALAGADWRGAARQVLETVFLSALLFGVLRVAFQNYVVESYSMEPTLRDGQQIWVSKLDDLVTGGPHRGDIVVFQAWGQDTPFVKRVVGLPGETVEVHDGRVWIDGVALDEPYLTQATSGRNGPVSLSADEVFVLGDNRGNSADSRVYGPLDEGDIVGRAWLRYWPVTEARLLTGPRSAAAGEP